MSHVDGRRICEILEDRGWILLRIRGAHRIYAKPGRRAVAVPVAPYEDLRPGTRRVIMRRADLTDDP